MKTRQAKSKAEHDDTWLMVGVFGIFLSIVMSFWALGYYKRTATPPLMALTINQAGCEYVASAGVATEKRDSICQIKVRYRKELFGDGGRIQRDLGGNLQLSAGQVVGLIQLDDGSDEPWTVEHKWAAALMGASLAGMFFFLWVMTRSTKRSDGHEP